MYFCHPKYIYMNQYETVFILNPVLSEKQVEEAVQKYTSFLKTQKGKLSNQENWGLRKLAYPIENKKSGFYHLLEFATPQDIVSELELEFRRDERVMRYLTVKLDKHAKAWADKRKKRNSVKTK